MKTRLQDQKIKSAKPPRTGRTELKDSNVDGLMIRITPKGVRTFCLAYKVPGEHPCGPSKTGKMRKGKQHRMTLGTYPMLTLADARDQARLLLESVDAGIDPRPVRAEAAVAAHTNTVSAVAKRFIAQECKPYIKSWRRVERTLQMYVLPAIGNEPIANIKRKDINKLIDVLVDEDRLGGPMPGAAREVIKHVHRLFDFAVDRGIIEANPAHKLKRKVLKANGAAGRPLNDAELRAIWHAAKRLGYPYGHCVRLLMLTGARRSEWAEASRGELDFEGRTHDIPRERYKTGRAHSVPLVQVAWDLIDDLPIWNEGDFLFSTTNGVKPINSHGPAKKKIDKLALSVLRRDEPDAELKPWRFHDLRKTCETRLAALGVTPEHRDRVSGRNKQGMQRIYNAHEYLDEKRAALELYAAHLMDIVQ